MTENERELINICKTPQVAEFMLKAMLCGIAHGTAFTDEIQGYINRGDVQGMIDIVDSKSRALA